MKNLFDDPTPTEANDPFPDLDESLTGIPKTEARLCVMQGIYQHLLMETPMPQIMDEYLLHQIKKREADKKLYKTIWEDVQENLPTYTQMVEGHIAEKWPAERLPLMEKAILLTGVAELHALPETPQGVVINEAINITKGFFDDKKAGFVNAVLDAITKKVR